ncbi:hypothetical protein AB0P37_01040 [Streptomyces antimycoticus]|uniref:hypothetical protein n=1 Tax=Streptomyces antimycoticus TaxID=68175 RepID=UPI003412A84A
MSAVAVEITARPEVDDELEVVDTLGSIAVEITPRPVVVDDVEFVDELDTVAGNEVMRGCGNDNPY